MRVSTWGRALLPAAYPWTAQTEAKRLIEAGHCKRARAGGGQHAATRCKATSPRRAWTRRQPGQNGDHIAKGLRKAVEAFALLAAVDTQRNHAVELEAVFATAENQVPDDRLSY